MGIMMFQDIYTVSNREQVNNGIGQNNGLRVYTTIMGRKWLKIMGVLMGYIQYSQGKGTGH